MFVLSVAGPGASKEATHRVKQFIAIAVGVAIVAAFIIAILLSYQEPHGLPLQEKVLESMGKPLEEVAAHLDVPVDWALEIEPGLYRIPAAGKHKGITFDILLQFEEHEGLLRNYGYEAKYEADAAKAAKDIARITKALAVDEIVLADATILGTGKGQLEKHITDNGAFTADASRSGSVLPVTALTEYLAYLEAADYYEGRSGEYLVKRAIYYEDLHITYEPESETLTMKLWCTIETDRTMDF
jgi:hypothetical protein